MSKDYQLDLINAGEDTYCLMSKGHHNIEEFAKAVKKDYPRWRMGIPETCFMVRAPRAGYASYYYECDESHKNAIPFTICTEDYSDEAKVFYAKM